MELKDYVFYPGCAAAGVYTVYQANKIFKQYNILKTEYPQCTETNPYTAQICMGTCAVVICV
jgi:hypothetical protein